MFTHTETLSFSANVINTIMQHIKAKYECLFFIQLPFREDVRPYTFPPLPMTGKLAPSAEQVCLFGLFPPTHLNLVAHDDAGIY